MIMILFSLLFCGTALHAGDNGTLKEATDTNAPLTIASSTQHMAKVPFLVVALTNKKGDEVRAFARELLSLLQLSEWQRCGFSVALEERTDIPSKAQMQEKAQTYDLILFISALPNGMIEWRLYDARQATMIKGGKSFVESQFFFTMLERLADEIMHMLTNQQSFYASRIAFCRYNPEQKNGKRQLCIVPAYISYKHPLYKERCAVLVEGRAIFAPRWNKDPYFPLLFYSQTKDTHVQLIASNMRKQKRIVSNVAGLNFQPSFSADSKKIVYCGTYHGKTQLFMYTVGNDNEASVARPFLPRDGNCISPYLCTNGDVFFCTDAVLRVPHICWYHQENGVVEEVTKEYSVCPSWCEKTKLLAYCKRIKGYMQLFVYDPASKQHRQLTVDNTNKEECSWSPCGTFIAYSVDNGICSRIALFNRLSNEQSFLTGPHEHCIYPVWSSAYHVPLNIS